MRLRVAKKIMKAIGTPRQSAYNGWQIEKAFRVCERTQSSKQANDFWHNLMIELGVEGRAKLLDGSGAKGMAFELLMREEW